MSQLFERLQRQSEANARQAVDLYTREVAEYRVSVSRSAMLDFAIFIRRRSVERAQADHELLRFVEWFGAQSVRARAAYLDGFAAGAGRSRSPAGRNELLTRMLVADEPVDDRLAARLGATVAPRHLVCVLRFPADPGAPLQAREEIVESLLRADPMPMAWLGAEEFVFLLPGGNDDEATEERAAALARKVVAELSRPCSAGIAHGRTGELAEALETARRISDVAPTANVRQQLYTVDDLFVEVGVAAAPWLDDWLRGYIVRLRPGPDLLRTLDVYFRKDMSRLGTASALHIHPRTLDYRLQRVRELTGLVPGSTRGVRILSAAVTRALGAGWC